MNNNEIIKIVIAAQRKKDLTNGIEFLAYLLFLGKRNFKQEILNTEY